MSEEFIILYMLDRIGEGAAADATDGGEMKTEPILQEQLNPDDILIFEDKPFKYSATLPIDPPNGTARRDVLVCTVDYDATYLETAS